MWLKPIRLIDTYFFGLLDAVCAPFVSRTMKPPSRIKKILVINLWGLGDSVVSLVLFDALHKAYPNATLEVLAHPNNAPILALADLPLTVHTFHQRSPWSLFRLFRRYDIVFDLEPFINASAFFALWCGRFRVGFDHRVRSRLYHRCTPLNIKQHMVQNYLDMARTLGVDYDTDRLLPLHVSDEVKDNVAKRLQGLSPFLVGITPGVGHTAKERMWPLERMAQLADRLVEQKGASVLLIDSPANTKDADRVLALMRHRASAQVLCDLSIPELCDAVRRCSLYITNDSGPSHIAAAQGVKVITLFGPMVPELWGPYGPNTTVLYHDLWCSPCVRNADGFFPKCFNKEYQKCMKLISVDEVLLAVKKTLQR